MADQAFMLPPEAANAQPLAPAKSPVAPPAPEAKPEPKPAEKPALQYDPSVLGKAQEKGNEEGAAYDKAAGALKPPTLNLPPKPEPKLTSPIEQWGSYAMIFAALGGMLSRNHATTALNAAAAVMNGYKQKDKDATDAAYRQWEHESDMTLKLANFQQKAYEQAIGDHRYMADLARKKGTEEEKTKEAQLKAVSTALGDDAVVIEAYNRGGWAEAAKVMKGREDVKNGLAEQRLKLSRGYEGSQLVEEYKASDEYRDATFTERLEHIAEIEGKFGTMSGKTPSLAPMAQNEIDFHAQQMADLKEGMPGPNLLRNPSWRAAAEKATELNPGLSTNDFKQVNEVQKQLTDTSPTKAGATLTAMGKLTHHIPTLEELASHLPNQSNIQEVNDWNAKLSASLEGHPEVPSFEVAKQVVSAEMLKAIASATGGDAELRKKYEELVSEKMNKDQIAGAVAVVKELVNGQLLGLKEHYESALPHTKDGKLQPASQQMLDQFFPPKLMDAFKPAPKAEAAPKSRSEAGAQPVKVDKWQDLANVPVDHEYTEGGYVSKMTAEKLAKVKAKLAQGGGQ